MFSRWMAFGTLGVLTALMGCGLKFGEKSSQPSGSNFSGRGYSCVGQIPQHVGDYVNDKLSDQQISDFMACLQRSFTSFGELTRGQDMDSYSPEEIRRFLQAFFFKERPITQELTDEFMVLKQVMIGGTADKITRKELNEFVAFLEDVRKEAIRLRPHLKYLNPNLIEAEKGQENLGQNLANANEAFKASIRVLTDRLERGKRDYQLENLSSLVQQFRVFVRWDETFQKAHPVQNWINFLRVFKQTVVSAQDPDVIHPGEWAPMLQGLSRWYVAFIQYHVGVKNQPKFYGSGLQNTMHLAVEVFSLAEDAVRRQKTKTREGDPYLSMIQINNLVTATQDLKWLPERIRAQSVDKALHAMFERVFAKSENERSLGLTLDNIGVMRSEFFRWAVLQKRVSSNFNMERIERESQVPKAPSLAPSFFVPADVRNRLVGLTEPDWEHFLKIKQLARPLFNDNLNRVNLNWDEDWQRLKMTQEFNNLSMMNVFRSLVWAMFRGYAGESRRRMDWGAGLKSEELQRFYEDVRDLAVDLALADERVKNTGSRAFIEGNLFTYAADGVAFDINKSRLSFVESMELLAFLYSGGKTSSDFYAQLRGAEGKPGLCPAVGALDLNDDPKLDRACVSSQLPNLIVHYGANMPGMNDYMRSAPPKDRDQIVKNLLDSAFSPKNCEKGVKIEECAKLVEYSELSIVAVVLHYLEAVLTRFDTNRDGILNIVEVRSAMPIFRGFIQRFAKENMNMVLSDSKADQVFLYILVYKEIPSGSWGSSFWVWWMGSNPTVNLNRAELSTVFRVIVAKIFDTVPVEQQIRIENGLPATSPAACQIPGMPLEMTVPMNCPPQQ